METIDGSYLVAAGILLIGLEALMFSFFLFFIGLGCILTGVFTYVYPFESGFVQLAILFTLSLVLMFALRNTLLEWLSKVQKNPEERTHISGVGFVHEGMIEFNGTFWETLDDLSAYTNGQRVQVVNVKDNKVILETKKVSPQP